MRIIGCGMKSLLCLVLFLAASVGRECNAQSLNALQSQDSTYAAWKSGDPPNLNQHNGDYLKGVYDSFEYSVIAADASWAYCEFLVADILELHIGETWAYAEMPQAELAGRYETQREEIMGGPEAAGNSFLLYLGLCLSDSQALIAKSDAWDAYDAWDNWQPGGAQSYQEASLAASVAIAAYGTAVDDFKDAVTAAESLIEKHNQFVAEVLIPLGDYVEFLLGKRQGYYNGGYDYGL